MSNNMWQGRSAHGDGAHPVTKTEEEREREKAQERAREIEATPLDFATQEEAILHAHHWAQAASISQSYPRPRGRKGLWTCPIGVSAGHHFFLIHRANPPLRWVIRPVTGAEFAREILFRGDIVDAHTHPSECWECGIPFAEVAMCLCPTCRKKESSEGDESIRGAH